MRNPFRSHATGAAAPGRRRGLGISLATRLALTLLGVGLASLVAATVVGVNAGQSLGTEIVQESLEAQRTAGSMEAAAQLRYYQRMAVQLADRRQTAVAIEEFAAALPTSSDASPSELRALREELLADYQDRYFGPLSELGESLQVEDVLATDPTAIILQSLYSVPEEPVTDPVSVSDAGDGSEWSEVHARFHNVYRTALLQGGLRDVLLVDNQERVVYTVAKGPDLGTSLEVGPFSGSLIASAAGAVANATEPKVTDLAYYRATPGEPLGAAAAPVIIDGVRAGSVVVTYAADIYTQLLTGLAEASRASGEQEERNLYLVGADGRTRSDPQTFRDDPDQFLDSLSESGSINEGERTIVSATGSTVLVVPVSDQTANAAADGSTEVAVGSSVAGEQVVGTVAQIPFDGLTWFAVSEVGVVTAEATISSFRRVLLFGAAAFVVALAFIAVAWANRTMRPIRIISDRLGKEAIARTAESGAEPVQIPERSPIEFHRLADSLTEMGRSLHDQRMQLRQARAERLSVMERMLPPAVAQRIERGDIEAVDEVPSASVAVVTVLGLADLVASRRDGDRELFDELHAELDDIATEHGLNRIKVVGDAYFAACGHDRPFIDHAPRVVAFAEAVAAAVGRLSPGGPVRLDTAIGISTGPVLVGMSGGSRLVYDVWGGTVSTAHQLARSAPAGRILLASTTRDRLPVEIEVHEWDGAVLGRADEDRSTVWAIDPSTEPSAAAPAEVGRP